MFFPPQAQCPERKLLTYHPARVFKCNWEMFLLIGCQVRVMSTSSVKNLDGIKLDNNVVWSCNLKDRIDQNKN